MAAGLYCAVAVHGRGIDGSFRSELLSEMTQSHSETVLDVLEGLVDRQAATGS